MANFVEVPTERLAPDVLARLLEEFASRDGTDYGEREHTLEEKVAQLHEQLRAKELYVLFDADSENWDLVLREQAMQLLDK